MSSQSAATRTASQATVNAYRPSVQGDRQGASGGYAEHLERTSSDKLTALALMVPAGIFGWLAVDWVTRLLT